MMMQILIPVAVLGAMGLVFGVGLAVAAKIFEVKVDERIPLVREALPGANCGGCGLPGCDALAEAIVGGNAAINACPVGGASCAEAIGEIMGQSVGDAIPTVACTLCKGSCDHSPDVADYYGVADCREILVANGGIKKCRYGCLGLGTCVKACKFDALKIGENGLPEVDIDKCTSCGQCVEVCPKNIMAIVPANQLIHIDCSNKDKGKLVRGSCDVGCIACRACVKVCPTEAIVVEDNLARIDYDKCIQCGACVEKCPTNAITQEDRIYLVEEPSVNDGFEEETEIVEDVEITQITESPEEVVVSETVEVISFEPTPKDEDIQ